jgi:hypothetical protein
LVSADLAGAEALIVAYLCKDGNFRQLFVNNIKPHTFVAMHLFASHWQKLLGFDLAPYLSSPVKDLASLPNWKVLSEAIKNDKTRYYIGKKSCHSFNYKLSWKSFIFNVLTETEGKLFLSNSEGERIFNTYHTILPEIQGDFHNYVEGIIDGPPWKTKILYNLFGHPKEIYQYPITDKITRECIAFIPQSTVGELTNIAFTECQQEIELSDLAGYDLLNNKHDSILMQVLNEEVHIRNAARILNTYLSKTFTNFRGETFTMKTEVKVGMNWEDYDKDKNPEGMKDYEKEETNKN